ncbi:SpoIIE family protein phosphatase [Streptomyces sp. NPDC005202]|uniref:SpoIIE family protein phosphatase n=1 Tax=Streptomyces sp. NPDC005202 TaxID=3157021 RepID=UPI0033B1A897
MGPADPFTPESGDILLLYTDGVIEARSPTGDFHPLAERVASFRASGPEAPVRHIHEDLLAHIGEQPTDDATNPPGHGTLRLPHLHRPHITARSVNGHRRLHASGSSRPADR